MKIFDFLRFKVLSGKPQRVRKIMALLLLAVDCVFLRRSNFLRHFLPVHYFLDSTVYTAFLFLGHPMWEENIKVIVKLLESNILNCCLKITMADLHKIGLKIIKGIRSS